jgi:hypothetical protein
LTKEVSFGSAVAITLRGRTRLLFGEQRFQIAIDEHEVAATGSPGEQRGLLSFGKLFPLPGADEYGTQ